jgi:hypothetical protein
VQLQVFASSGLRLALRATFPHSLRLLPLAGVGLGQGVSVRTATAKTIQTGEQNTMTNAAATTTNDNVVSLPSTPKPQTSKEIVAANVNLLIEQLEAGHSEGLTAYLTAMGKFHNYSFGNILEIARQKAVT